MTNYEKLINTLKEVFMLDKADLDFGIYRIMNQKRSEIENFLQKDLVPQVKKVLAENLSVDKKGLQKELEEAIAAAKTLGADPDTLPKVIGLKKRLGEAADIEGMENEVFSLLANFFKRYFDNGDFISMRRYKKDVYAIPYEGEEMKLHWANADQYYIKTSEYFKNYRFKLGNGNVVCFELVEAETEQNNNKIQGDKERKFALYIDKPVEEKENELKIFFTYEAMDGKIKQEDLLNEAFDAIKDLVPSSFIQVFEKAPTEKDKNRTLLQKHLRDYTARNTFDYFIHKDLNGFLTRELDFYIKNEVLFIDDINTRDEQEFVKQLSKIKAVKKIGEKIITFLAQLEDFQKKLWLKKKFVVATNYCITLDRIPENFYDEIASNEAQINEWIRLFAIDEIVAEKAKDMFGGIKTGYSKPLSKAFLKENPFLLLDTAFFSEDFKWLLLSQFENFDEQCDGVLINSDNIQALNLLQARYHKRVKCIYIDPPYNTSEETFVYKNLYKHSSWMTMMHNRISLSNILCDDGVLINAIDDEELYENKMILDSHFGADNYIGTVVMQTNPRGRGISGYFATSHDYLLFYGKDIDKVVIENQPLTDDQKDDFNFKDEISDYRLLPFRRSGGLSTPSDRANSEFSLIYDTEQKQIVAVGGKRKYPYPRLYEPIEYLAFDSNNEVVSVPVIDIESNISKGNWIKIFPIDTDGERRVWRWSDRGKILDAARIGDFVVQVNGAKVTVQLKDRIKVGRKPKTIWYDSKYDASSHGTILIENILGDSRLFGYPKSLYNVIDSLYVIVGHSKDAIVIDYFGGSGTTGHATIQLNRDDQGNRKYVLVEMGTYFDTVTKPRIQKVIYSKEWNSGKPVKRDGISQCFKYMRLESYEDTLNNLELKRSNVQTLALDKSATFKEGYMLSYMLDVESKDSLLNMEWFIDPFSCYLNITSNNEMQPTKVDLVETFNYLIGLVVEHMYAAKGYRVVIGKSLDGDKILVVWRNIKEHNNEALNEFLIKSSYNPLDGEFNRIYVNGDNNVENLKTGDESWKVALIEEEFKKRMFE